MWESILLTVVATAGNNIGKILQKKGTLILPPLSFKLKVIKAYASNKTWLIGFLMDIIGALLMLRALALAPAKKKGKKKRGEEWRKLFKGRRCCLNIFNPFPPTHPFQLNTINQLISVIILGIDFADPHHDEGVQILLAKLTK